MSSPYFLSLLLVCALGAAACGREVPPPRSTAIAPSAPPAMPAAPATAESDAATAPSMEVRSLEGSAAEGARQALARVDEPLRRCEAGKGLLLAMTLRGEGDDARLEIEPGTGVDAALRRCVMEAISTADFPEVLDTRASSGGVTAEPRRFSAQLVLRW